MSNYTPLFYMQIITYPCPNLDASLAISVSTRGLNIKTVLSTYGDFHVKDKTAVSMQKIVIYIIASNEIFMPMYQLTDWPLVTPYRWVKARKTSVTVSVKQYEHDRVTRCTFSADFKEIKTISQSLPSMCAICLQLRQSGHHRGEIETPRLSGTVNFLIRI